MSKGSPIITDGEGLGNTARVPGHSLRQIPLFLPIPHQGTRVPSKSALFTPFCKLSWGMHRAVGTSLTPAPAIGPELDCHLTVKEGS